MPLEQEIAVKPRSLHDLILALSALAIVPAAALASDIVATAKADGHFGQMLDAGQRAGVAGWLRSPGPITVFAPNDDAFAKVPQAMLDDLMKPANRVKLKMMMGNHAVAGLVTQADIDKGLAAAPAVSVTAVNNMPLVIKREGGGLTVNGAHVIKGPMKVDNGLVYVVDAVLIPPMPIQPRL
jgi:uncharacterized surface protein with fasciclin (FAS1) repeats